MNKYLEKIASRKKGGQLQMRTGQKPIRHSKNKPFVSLNAKIKSLKTKGSTHGK